MVNGIAREQLLCLAEGRACAWYSDYKLSVNRRGTIPELSTIATSLEGTSRNCVIQLAASRQDLFWLFLGYSWHTCLICFEFAVWEYFNRPIEKVFVLLVFHLNLPWFKLVLLFLVLSTRRERKNCFCSLLPSWRLRGAHWSFLGRTLPDCSACLSVFSRHLILTHFLWTCSSSVLCWKRNARHWVLYPYLRPQPMQGKKYSCFTEILFGFMCLAFFSLLENPAEVQFSSGQADLWDAVSIKWSYKVSHIVWAQENSEVTYAK